MDVSEAIETRRTYKRFQPDPIPDGVLLELLDLARWAPNHNLTNPWRFHVLGPGARHRLKSIADNAKPGSGTKLDRAPTLVVPTVIQTGEPIQDNDDLLATAAATYILLLAAHARGIATYWRTLTLLAEPQGRNALGLPPDERPLGLIHLGYPNGEAKPTSTRASAAQFVRFLD